MEVDEVTKQPTSKKRIHFKNPYASSAKEVAPKKAPHDWVRRKKPILPTKQTGRKKGPVSKKPIDPMMAKKQDFHAKKQLAQTQKTNSNDEENKYNYLMKKDWDELVLNEDKNMDAFDFRKQNVMKLSEVANLPFNPSNYEASQTNTKLAKSYIKELLNVPKKMIL